MLFCGDFKVARDALQDLGRYEAKLGDIGFDCTLHLLGATERESLALAVYLRDQLDEVKANDYSASIIHVTPYRRWEPSAGASKKPTALGSHYGTPGVGLGEHRRPGR